LSLRQSISTPEGKRRYVRRLFATIADRYDFITRFLSYGQDGRWKRRLIRRAALQPSERVLDLASGTGDIAYAAASAAKRVVGLDVTFRMLQLARKKNETWSDFTKNVKSDQVSFVTGDMLALPFANGAFDVITVGYGLRNVPDLDAALAEIARVLTPNGRLLSLDFNRPANPLVRSVYLAYLTVVGSTLGTVLHGDPDTYRYIPASIRLYPGAPAVARMMQSHGFTHVEVIPVLGGLMAMHVATRGRLSP
jgi:ubiquinone/menaquinone biosynthesis methyltransferase